MSHATPILFYHTSVLTLQNSLISHALLVATHIMLRNLELCLHESWTRFFTPHCKAHSDNPKPFESVHALAPVLGAVVERTMNMIHVPHHNLCVHNHSNIQTTLNWLLCALQLVLDHQSHLLLKTHLYVVEASIPAQAPLAIYKVPKFRSS